MANVKVKLDANLRKDKKLYHPGEVLTMDSDEAAKFPVGTFVVVEEPKEVSKDKK